MYAVYVGRIRVQFATIRVRFVTDSPRMNLLLWTDAQVKSILEEGLENPIYNEVLVLGKGKGTGKTSTQIKKLNKKEQARKDKEEKAKAEKRGG